MRYFCICMAPAIDVTTALDRLPEDGEIVKNVYDWISPGGKGVNVARYLALRGAFVSCGGLLGIDDAPMFRRELGRYGVADRFSSVPGPVRRNETILTPGRSFKMNRAAYPGLSERDCLIDRDLTEATVIISGGLPAEFRGDYYARLIDRVRKAGAVRVALDTSGDALKGALPAHPDLLKINADECAALVGFRPTGDEDFKRAVKILKDKAGEIVISDGARGCWFGEHHVDAPATKVLDTTAAGDTLLAEYAFSGNEKFAVEAASAACSMPGGEPPREWLKSRLVTKPV